MKKQVQQEKSIQGSWIPQTPYRPILPTPSPIYTDTQANKVEQANRQESKRGFSVQGVSGLEHLPFGDLLALANAASAAFVGAAPWVYHGNVGGSCPSASSSQSNCCQVESPSAAFWYTNPELSNGFNIGINGIGTVERPQCGLPTSLQYPYHLSCTSDEVEKTTSQITSNEFAPITPQKAMRIEGKQFPNRTNQQRDEQGNETAAARLNSHEVQCLAENQAPLAESSLAADSALVEEKNLDKCAEEVKTPQKPRRRKHRPKVVTEGKPKRTPKPRTQKPVDDGTGKPKRKYVRKKGVNKDSTPTSAEAREESCNAEKQRPAKKSCKRALNFEDEQPKAENSLCKSTLNLHSKAEAQNCSTGETRSNSKLKPADGTEPAADDKQAGIACDPIHSGNQETEQGKSLPEGTAPNTPLPKSKPCQRKRNARPQRGTKKNGRNSVTVHSDEQFVAQFIQQFGNNVVAVTGERQGMESERDTLRANDQANATGTNLFGLQYNSLQEYQQMSWLYCPNNQMKKRTDKGQISTTSSILFVQGCSRGDECMAPSAPRSNGGISTPQSNTSGVLTLEEVGPHLLSEMHTIERITGLNQKERSTKKRSRSNIRIRDLASLNRILDGDVQTNLSRHVPATCDSQEVGNPNGPQTGIETIIAEMQSTLSKKKRTKKSKELQNQKNFLQNHQQLSVLPAGTPDEIWKQSFSVDAISEQLRLLDINRKSRYIPYQEMALVPYTIKVVQEQNALVLYRSDGTIVPFEGPFYTMKKRRPRPRVDLDNETNRVWKLLMGNINNEGIDGTDEEKAKWWEEERRVFQGRTDSFIARMHLVQGDRRFTPWKGSVVDSVIGVFLTQNVSDHLSSSAFMSMAARFPLDSNCNHKPNEGESSAPHEPLIYMVDSEESMSTPPACNRHIQDNIQHNEEKEAVNCDETSRSSSEIVSSTNESICKVVNSSGTLSDACHTSNAEVPNIEVEGIEPADLIRDRRETDDLFPADDSVLSPQASVISVTVQNIEKTGSRSGSNSEGENLKKGFNLSNLNAPTSFMELLQMAGTTMLQGHGKKNFQDENVHIQTIAQVKQGRYTGDPSNPKSTAGESEDKSFRSLRGEDISSVENNEPSCSYQQDGNIARHSQTETLDDPSSMESKNELENQYMEQHVNLPQTSTAIPDVTESTSSLENHINPQHKQPDTDIREQGHLSSKELNQMNEDTLKPKGKKVKEKKDEFDWDSLRRDAESSGGKRERTARTMDSVDWEAVRTADVNEIATTIKDRGMNNVLAGRIQDFLNRLVRQHGSIDLEWLRDVPPDKAKEYLLSFRGLGLKSVECVRLLTLHHLAFPVDTNVGRIAVRLGWVPLQPLPESLQLHLLELYPVLESIQKYLWPRLCKLDQKTLYELHYQMITFGKVFCTKSKPNCNACPMRGECRHFASAFASARLALTGPEEKSIVSANENGVPHSNPVMVSDQRSLPLPQVTRQTQGEQDSEANTLSESACGVTNCEPIIEEPATPEPECAQVSENDIEDAFFEDPEEIPTIRLNMDAFTKNLKNYMQHNMELQEGDMSNALVALTAEAASIPIPKLKNVSQLRTEHQVYELPDSHPLLEGLDKREPDDPCSYLLAIWTPGETANSIQLPDRRCSEENGKLCDNETCFSCNTTREATSHTVRGTLLIPCRTAMRGSFPLNGTYFQVNEVFADHDSSLDPIDVPRDWIWNLPRKTVYFGTSIPTIFRGLTTEGIQHCFWRGYVCVRGFDQKTRAPRPLMARLHFPASKLTKTKGKTNAGDNIDG